MPEGDRGDGGVLGGTAVPQSSTSQQWFKLSGATVKKSIDKYLVATNQKMQQSDLLWTPQPSRIISYKYITCKVIPALNYLSTTP
jgi:hypothetical protein